jgi:hypothetical protein
MEFTGLFIAGIWFLARSMVVGCVYGLGVTIDCYYLPRGVQDARNSCADFT